MIEPTKKQIERFVFDLLQIRTDPSLVNGKYASPIIFNCRDFDISKGDAVLCLKEIKGYHCDKNNIPKKFSDLEFKNIENDILEITGYSTLILQNYLIDELDYTNSLFGVYKKNSRTYLSFMKNKTTIEISGDELCCLRVLIKNKDQGNYISWKILFAKMKTRRGMVGNLASRYTTNEKQMNYVYQIVNVSLLKLLLKTSKTQDKNRIINHKYGGDYKLAM